MKYIRNEFEIKNDEYGPPTSYLGAGVSQVQLERGKECWSMDSRKYVKTTIEVVHNLLAKNGQELKTDKQGKGYHHCNEEHAFRF